MDGGVSVISVKSVILCYPSEVKLNYLAIQQIEINTYVCLCVCVCVCVCVVSLLFLFITWRATHSHPDCHTGTYYQCYSFAKYQAHITHILV